MSFTYSKDKHIIVLINFVHYYNVPRQYPTFLRTNDSGNILYEDSEINPYVFYATFIEPSIGRHYVFDPERLQYYTDLEYQKDFTERMLREYWEIKSNPLKISELTKKGLLFGRDVPVLNFYRNGPELGFIEWLTDPILDRIKSIGVEYHILETRK